MFKHPFDLNFKETVAAAIERRSFLRAILGLIPFAALIGCKELTTQNSNERLGQKNGKKPSGNKDPNDSDVTTEAIGEEGGDDLPDVTTMAVGEEGGMTTKAIGEEGGASTEAVGEEGGDKPTTLALGEEGGTTKALGEEGGNTTTDAANEEGGDITTMAYGEEGGTTTSSTGKRAREGEAVIRAAALVEKLTIIYLNSFYAWFGSSANRDVKYNMKLKNKISGKTVIVELTFKQNETISDFDQKVRDKFSSL